MNLLYNSSNFINSLDNKSTKAIGIWKFSFLLYFLGSIGNGLIVIYFLCKHKRSMIKMSSYHFLITILAAVDLLVCIENGCWYLMAPHGGNYPHLMMWLIRLTLRSFSCWMLVLISFERFRGIVHPLKVKLSKIRFLVLAIIIFLVLFSIYMAAVLRMYSVTDLERLLWIVLSTTLLETVPPISLMCGFYWRISRNIITGIAQSTTPGNYKLILKRKKKVMHVLKLLIMAYCVCVVPGRIYKLIDELMFRYFKVNATQSDLYNAAELLMYLNNMVNVIIYAYMMNNFRRFLLKAFTCSIF